MVTLKTLAKHISFLLFFALIVLSMVSCSGETSSDVREFKMEKTDYKDWAKLLNVESVVQLQENDSCLMSFAQKCIFTNDQIVFWEYKAKKIYTFSYNGRFLRQIGRMGHSASEYTNIDDICMSDNDSIMMLLDNRGVVCYDVNSGKFVERKKLFSQKFGEYQRIAPVGNSKFLCSTYSETPSSIVLDSPKGQMGLREGKRFHLGTDCFYKYQNAYRVVSDYGDFYIDSYEDGKLKTLYKINLGVQAFPEDVLPKTWKEFDVSYNSQKYFKCISYAYETDGWLFLRLTGPNQEYYAAFINKRSGAYALGRETPLGLTVMGVKDNSFYALVYPNEEEQGTLWRKILEKYNITKNSPVVVKLKLNENILQ